MKKFRSRNWRKVIAKAKQLMIDPLCRKEINLLEELISKTRDAKSAKRLCSVIRMLQERNQKIFERDWRERVRRELEKECAKLDLEIIEIDIFLYLSE